MFFQSSILTQGIAHVWDTDTEFQSDCLNGILENIRHVTDPHIRELQLDYLRNLGAFYIPRGEYLVDHFGSNILASSYGIFMQDYCALSERLAIPLYAINKECLGFVGYSNKPSDFPDTEVFIKYLYPPKYVFNKGRFFFMSEEEYASAVANKYVCIVDGFFDKVTLQCLGIPTVSLCGSALTSWHKLYLDFIPHKIVIADNDSAGRKLANYCKQALSRCVELKQPNTSDIDELIRTEHRAYQIKNEILEMKSEGFLYSHSIRS